MFVAQADIVHERVHDSEYIHTMHGVKTYSGVSVYCDSPDYGLYGITDCIEARKDSDGVSIAGENGRYRLCIVEYKPTKPKDKDWREEDLMQVFAQKICVDHIFGGNCEAVIYYANVRKRVVLPVQEEYMRLDCELREILKQMRIMLAQRIVPPIPKGQRCSGCSMKDVCLPVKKSSSQVRSRVMKLLEE